MAASAQPISCTQALRPEKAQSAADAAEPPAAPRARAALSPPTQGSCSCSDLDFWGCGGSAGELSPSFTLLAAKGTGALAAASRAPSQPGAAPGLLTRRALTSGAGLRTLALGPDGCIGWDLGLLELMSNRGSAETGSEVSGEAGPGGGGGWCLSSRRAQRASQRGQRRGRGGTPKQSVRLERGRTKGNRGAGRREGREACLAARQVVLARGQRSLVPLMPVDLGMAERGSFPPRLRGALFCQVPGRCGAGVVFEPTDTRMASRDAQLRR